MNNLIKAKYLFKHRNELVSDKEYEPLSVTQNGVVPRLSNVALSKVDDNRKKVCKDDIVLNSRSARRGSSGVSIYDGCVSGVNHVIFSDKILPKSSHYFIKSQHFMDQYYIHGKGIHDDIWGTRIDELLSIKIPFYKKEKQKEIIKSIENFENIIKKKRNISLDKIKLLKLFLKSKTNEILFGKNSSLRFKENTLEIDLEKKFSSWTKIRLNFLGNFYKGRGLDKSKLKDTGVPCILYGEIYSKYNIKFNKSSSFTDKENEKSSELVYKNDILLTASGETSEEIGKAIAYMGNEPILAGGDVIIFRIKDENKINPIFLSYFLNSLYGVFQKEVYAKGYITFHIYETQLQNLVIFYPTIKEQNKIVKQLNFYYETIDSAIEKETSKLILYDEIMKIQISKYFKN
jgi:type I restriction enzyme S subunit